MPIPYMGSKNKSCYNIANVIENHCKGYDKVIYEPFTGGFAVGEVFMKKGYTVYANDMNKYVIALLEQVFNVGLDIDKCLEFITRDKFNDIIKNPSKYDDWYVGYTQCLWSFGNNQKKYLLGKDREGIYQEAYNLIVYKKISETIKKILPQKYIDGIIKQETVGKRRMAFRKCYTAFHKNKMQLESLERLERLKSLQSLESKVIFTAGSYDKMYIPKGVIIYCDPPYQNTATYSEGGFDHKKFWEWVREKSKTNKVFVSEYTAPSDMTCIYEFEQKSTLSSKGSTDTGKTEKLFIYKIPNVKNIGQIIGQ